jgi:hypothetical protein
MTRGGVVVTVVNAPKFQRAATTVGGDAGRAWLTVHPAVHSEALPVNRPAHIGPPRTHVHPLNGV